MATKMASEEEEQIPEYERRRLENIKRNAEMMTSLRIHSRLSDLSAASKLLRPKVEKKWQKQPAPAVIRRSLRTQGISEEIKTCQAVSGPTSMKQAYKGEGEEGELSLLKLVQKFTLSHQSQITKLQRVTADIHLKSFNLEPQNVARLVSGYLTVVRFLPTTAMTMVLAGNKNGQLGLWDVRHPNQDDDSDQLVHLFRPTSAAVSGISVHPFTLSKVYTSSYDGLLRSMNIEREEFDVVYSSNPGSKLYSLSQHPDDANSTYVGQGLGGLKVFDARAREVVNSWSLHGRRVNSIDFNLANPNIMATSSTDCCACLWDLRKMGVKDGKSRALHTVNLGQSVLSAFFSPSGIRLGMSVDGDVTVLGGANFEDLITIHDRDCHGEYRLRRNAIVRAVWGWDDTHLFVGDTKRRINILSVTQSKIVHSLESSLMPAISTRYDAHPYNVGMLAAATPQGYVYTWTLSS